MSHAHVAIVGGGLSGLYAAAQLEQRGTRDYVLFEARDVLGGRIASVPASGHQASGSAAGDIDRFDLGPTWFWPDYQSQLDRLVHDLGLHRFKQYETGDMMVERSPNERPTRRRGYVNSPASMRLVGGMAALIDALRSRVDGARIITGQTVQRLHSSEGKVELDSADVTGRITTWTVRHVLLALPPRLAEERIAFSPALPDALAGQWRDTATWMAPHAKYIAVYETPFWIEQRLSGEGRSACGPLGEIHDTSMPGGSAALFGFFGLPARVRSSVPQDVLRAHCRAQLTRLFGPKAATPKAELIKDWAGDAYTAAAADLDATAGHPHAPAAAATSGPWRGRLTGIGSEWSPRFPGYLAGAIEAAALGVAALADVTTT